MEVMFQSPPTRIALKSPANLTFQMVFRGIPGPTRPPGPGPPPNRDVRRQGASSTKLFAASGAQGPKWSAVTLASAPR